MRGWGAEAPSTFAQYGTEHLQTPALFGVVWEPPPQWGTGLQKQLLGTVWLPDCLHMVGCRRVSEKNKQGCKTAFNSSLNSSVPQAELRTQIYKNTRR